MSSVKSVYFGLATENRFPHPYLKRNTTSGTQPILDAFSRRCVGWALSRDMTTQLTLAGLRRAIEQRHPRPGLIHHSNRGVQYASHDYIEQLEHRGAQISMSSVGNPYENAKAESFFKTLKLEEVYLKEVYLKEYESFADAEANLEEFIEQVYNAKRLHSSLGYVPPAEFEASYATVASR
jgi:putative transposase